MASPASILRGKNAVATPAASRHHGLLAEVSRLVSYRYDLPETFDGLLQHLRRALHVDLLTLALPDEARNVMRLIYSRSTDMVQLDPPSELSFNDSPSATAYSTQKLVTVNDVANDRRWPALMKTLRTAGIGTYCSVPLTAGDRRIGALAVGSLKQHAFGNEDLQLLRQVAIPVAMAVENEQIREYADRYKQDSMHARDHAAQLLQMSTAVADHPTIRAVLHSLRGVLSSTSSSHGAELYLLIDGGDALEVSAFDREVDAPPINIGTKVLRIGAAAQVLDEQRPVFVPDSAQEMLKHPALAPLAPSVAGRSAYLFPVSTSRKQYGVLSVTKLQGQVFLHEDVEVMRALASHLAVALECALARDRAELYQQEVMKERDRLSLLLEINNHIVSKLEAEDLFQAVAGSMRKHFGNDLTSLWLVNKETGCLERKYLDFPTGRGFFGQGQRYDGLGLRNRMVPPSHTAALLSGVGRAACAPPRRESS